MSQATKDIILHALTVFLVAFAGVLTTTHIGDASMSTLVSVLYSGATAGVIALANYLQGLIPNVTVLAQRKAAKAEKAAAKLQTESHSV